MLIVLVGASQTCDAAYWSWG